MKSAQRIATSRALWLFPVALTLHNLEEALWLPGWSANAGAFHPPVGAAEFRFALAVLTVAGYWLTWMALRRGGRWLQAFFAASAVMLLNVFFPHLLATLVLGRYAPGLGTALLCILPVTALLLRRAFQEGALTWSALAGGGVRVFPIVLVGIPLLFWLGRHLFAT
jgi:hypothetical protein